MKTKQQPQKRVRGHWTTAPPARSRRPNPAAAFNAGERKFLYKEAVKESSDEPCCRTCGKPFKDHLGVEGTCQRAKTALNTLRQIADLPPRCSRRARALAESCIEFLAACERERIKATQQADLAAIEKE